MKFVLVHGGWQGGWVWDGVRAALSVHGHNAYAPTLRGIGVNDMGENLVHQIKRQEIDGFVLIGHSGGGPVAQYVADRMADRVRRIVFMSAWVLRDGESINDLRPKDAVTEDRRLAARDNTIPMAEAKWRATFMQDGSPDDLDTAVRRMAPAPFGWFDEPIRRPRFFDLGLPSSYIFLRQDQAIPRERAERMAARLGTPRLVECEGSHQAMQSRPHEVAGALIAASADDFFRAL